MASTNDIIFPESMEDILANPVDICFGSMPATSTTPAACLVIEGNTVTTDQQIGTDLLTETHPPTPSDLIVGIDCVEGMLSDTIITYLVLKFLLNCQDNELGLISSVLHNLRVHLASDKTG
jgi:hypothetical protein